MVKIEEKLGVSFIGENSAVSYQIVRPGILLRQEGESCNDILRMMVLVDTNF